MIRTTGTDANDELVNAGWAAPVGAGSSGQLTGRRLTMYVVQDQVLSDSNRRFNFNSRRSGSNPGLFKQYTIDESAGLQTPTVILYSAQGGGVGFVNRLLRR